jgi:hypothetical protein
MRALVLAETALASHPRLRVLLTSGFPDFEADGEATAFPLLSKPYRKADLARAVRQALDCRAQSLDS